MYNNFKLLQLSSNRKKENDMKIFNPQAMTPSELELSRIENTAIIANTRAGKKLKAVERELARRKKDIWRPRVLREVERTGQHSGMFHTDRLKNITRMTWEHSTREPSTRIIDVVKFDILI